MSSISPKRWFILLNGQVEGPFPETEIEEKAKLNPAESLIWGKGLSEWLNLDTWKNDREKFYGQEKVEKEVLWRYRFNENISQPMSFAEITRAVRDLPETSDVQIANDQENVFQDIYHYPKLIEELGITRRAHPRVPIMGSLEAELNSGIVTMRVISISEGGLGITEAKALSLGQKFKAHLKSPNLFMTINCHCEAVYVGQDGYAGIKFHNLNTEFHSAIIEYVKKFSEVKLV